MLKQKHIDAARETRLWIGQILVPVATTVLILAANPDVRAWVSGKTSNIKARFKRKEAENDQQITLGPCLYPDGNRINNKGYSNYCGNRIVNCIVYIISMD